jgi:hypothetical protein
LLGLTPGPECTVLLNGKPWRGVGVNYFSCFNRSLRNAADTSADEGFRELATYHIPFVRFCATGFYPNDMRLYQSDPNAYFELLDRVVRSAEMNGIGLIPSLFWYYATVPDMMGEPVDQWGNPSSKTHAFMRRYTHDVVSRYKDSPAIWAWEFGNEYNCNDNFNGLAFYASRNVPQVSPRNGTPAARTERDYPNAGQLAIAFQEFAKAVRRDDPFRLIESGADLPHRQAWHYYKERNSKNDSPEQFESMLSLANPDPMSLIDVHCYNDWNKHGMDRLEEIVACSRRLGKPLFVGEFQFLTTFDPTSGEARTVIEQFLARLDRLKVPLAALWVYDLTTQEKERNVTGKNKRAWELELLRTHNDKVAKAQ